MRPAASADAFLASPVGRYVAGDGYVVWCATPSLCGSTHWGAVGEREVRQLLCIFDFVAHPDLAPPIEIMMSCRDIEPLDGEVLRMLAEYALLRLPMWGERVGRQAVVLPPGASRFAVAGILPALGPTFSLVFFEDDDDALASLTPDARHHWLTVERVVRDARADPPELARLRKYLAGRLRGATLPGAASALGVSSRALQRTLAALATTFSGELASARVRAAQALLLETPLKVEVVASRVGFASASHLGSVFRRLVGVTPAAYRARELDRRLSARHR